MPGPSEHADDPASSRLAEELLAHTESVPWGYSVIPAVV